MGRRNKAYYKDLHQQAYDKLVGMQAFGESKRAAVVAGTDKEKIFSFNTYKSYWKHTKYFIQYIKEHHPEFIERIVLLLLHSAQNVLLYSHVGKESAALKQIAYLALLRRQAYTCLRVK